MAMTETKPTTEGTSVEADSFVAPTAFEKVIGSGDHTTVGRGFILGGLFGLLLSGVGLALAAANLIPDEGFGVPSGMWVSSLLGLVVLGVAPLLVGLALVVVPRQVASPAVAFPGAAALALWTWAVAGVLYVVGILLDGGITGGDIDGARLSMLSLGAILVALSIALSCIATTVLSHRPLGMGLSKVPFFSWSMLVAAPVWILSFASAAAHIVVGQISHTNAAGLALIYESGIAWLVGAPAVYMLAIPALGIAADVVARASRRRIKPYGALQGAIGMYAVLSFGAWAQAASARQTALWALVVIAAAVPLLAVLGGLADTLRRGKLDTSPAVLCALLAIVLALLGVLVAALQALDTAGAGYLWGFNAQALAWSQGLFLFAAASLGAFAGLATWSTQVFGSAQPGPFAGSGLAVMLGGGLGGLVMVVQAIATADGGSGLADGLFYGLMAVAGVLVALGGLGGLAAAGKSASTDAVLDENDGLTFEWAAPVDADSGYGDDRIEYVLSPYPLLDRRGETGEEH